jgi:hypothetical protein
MVGRADINIFSIYDWEVEAGGSGWAQTWYNLSWIPTVLFFPCLPGNLFHFPVQRLL